jgi:hypothetical protein
MRTAPRRRRAAAVLCAAVALAIASAAPDAQCSMCRTLLATPEGESMASALRTGIWVLLAAPFGALGVIALAVMKSRRRIEALRRDRG